MEKFGEAAVIASTHTVVLVQNAYEAGYLPRRNPIAIYFLFAAALVLLSNEFGELYVNVAADQCIQNSVTIMSYCGEADPQAKRLLEILVAFKDVVVQQRKRRQDYPHYQAGVLSYGIRELWGHDKVRHPSETLVINAFSEISQSLQNSQQNQYTFNLSLDKEEQPLPPLARSVQNALQGSPNQRSLQCHYPVSNISESTDTSNLVDTPSSSQMSTSQQRPALSNNDASPMTLGDANPPMDLGQGPTADADKHFSLSNLLDVSALEGAKVPSLHSEESSGPEEQFDFDALWAWPSNPSAAGTPRYPGMQDITDTNIPLFGVVDKQ